MSIHIKEVSKFFSNQKALDNVVLSLDEGDVVGFLGPNGAGKSTLMKIISGYMRPSSGIVSVLGMDIQESRVKVQQEIGYLPEHNPLYDELYIREYLRHVASLYGVKRPKDRVEEMIALCGISKESNKKIGMLSKGYKQRVGLAQALLHDPKVLILDEPMNGLDPNQIIEIRELIKNVSVGKTVLFSSHIMSEVSQMCDRVVIINEGKIVADDRCDILLREHHMNPRYKVKFKLPLNQENIEQLSVFAKVQRIDHFYLIEARDHTPIEEHIFWFAVETKNPIMHINMFSSELEDVFKSLTTRG
ncbi:ATP-binding cassette domain-containing protein [Halosquirtibacter laminarini]|uniref:ATP-binding cassette domain-containing protein n=1 Tax=Halosquirtibacter laminarini TaxID=3374600 RepID=A0AC61NER6_9BACT|nr:ATP-binding cassette domain-containing protein [Prolixibacteraceae bacterium]